MAYFDNAATTYPKPEGVWKAVYECGTRYCGNPGRSGHYYSMKTGEKIMETRECIKDLIGAESAMAILFTANATEALNLGIVGMLKPGDHVVTTSMEHNSVLRPLKKAESRGVELTILSGNREGFVSPDKVEQAIRSNTKMIVCTHASNVCGSLQPVREIGTIAKKRGILFFVDGSQTMGSIGIDVKKEHVDLLAAPGHKGLLGPQGTGFLYLRPDLGGQIEPLLRGGTGTISKSLRQPEELPEKFESGTLNGPGIVGLGAGIRWIQAFGGNNVKKGMELIRSWEEELTGELEEELRNMEGIRVYGAREQKRKTGIVAFNILTKNCEETASVLWERYNIAVRAGYHCAGLAHRTLGTWETGAVRISMGPFNTKKEIAGLVQAIYKVCRE